MAAVVISANGPHDALPQDALAAAVDAQLRRQAPGAAAARLAPRDRRAPGDLRLHAGTRATRAPGARARAVYLAGDYTDADFPATLEAAVRSGVRAADAALGRPLPAAA